MNRFFLGWDQPFVTKAVDWLWERRDQLAQALVVVPTMESGRKLRQVLAEKGACLAPQVCTAGMYGAMGYVGKEQPLLEQLVWQSVLEDFNWAEASEIFPKPEGDFWAQSLAQELCALRVQTGEYSLSFGDVTTRIGSEHPDQARWRLLGRWEYTFGLRMKKLEVEDSHTIRNAKFTEAVPPLGVERVILVGVTDPTAHAVRMARTFSGQGLPHDILIGAPESEAEGFDDAGIPISEYWLQQEIDWKGGNEMIFAANEPRAMAEQLRQNIAQRQSGSSVALGVGDKAQVPLIQSVLAKSELHVFNPAGKSLGDWSFVGWMRAWMSFCQSQKVSDLMILARSSWSQKLLAPEAPRTSIQQLSEDLQKVCTDAKPNTVDDLWHLRKSDWPFDERRQFLKGALGTVLDFLTGISEMLKQARYGYNLMELKSFLVTVLGEEESEEAFQAEAIFTKLEEEAAVLTPKMKLDFAREFLLRLEAASVGESREKVHLEALGWLELAFEQAPDLMITGLNEGVLPNTEIGDSWLPESLRKVLGMKTNQDRFAHDIYYLKSLQEARKKQGTLQAYFLKFGARGEPMKPSRLLLKVLPEQLAARVSHCFAGKSMGLQAKAWQRDWVLQVEQEEYDSSLSASKIKDYIACPFRFYLKHKLKMKRSPENLSEWDHMEFGTIAHSVLEAMGRDAYASKLREPFELHQWLTKALDEDIARRFASDIPLAFRIQRESLVQRLLFFAQVECEQRTKEPDWEVDACEEPFELVIEGVTISGVIDRVDRHKGGQYRLVDYKTGRVSNAKTEHIKTIPKAGIPEHLAGTKVEFLVGDKAFYWANLQLPIYGLAYLEKTGRLPELAYCALGASVKDTAYSFWEFTEEQADDAREALRDIVLAIKDQKFTPAAEKVKYDDYEAFGFGQPLIEGINFEETETA